MSSRGSSSGGSSPVRGRRSSPRRSPRTRSAASTPSQASSPLPYADMSSASGTPRGSASGDRSSAIGERSSSPVRGAAPSTPFRTPGGSTGSDRRSISGGGGSGYRSSSPTRTPASQGSVHTPASNFALTSSPLPYGSGTGAMGTPGSTPRARSDIGTPGRFREIELGGGSTLGGRTSMDDSRSGGGGASSTDGARTSEHGGHQARTVIWGTDVNVKDATDRFRAFFNRFIEAETGQPKYPRILEQVHQQGESYLDLDCRDLAASDARLYDQLKRYPQEIIPIFDVVIDEEYARAFGQEPDVPFQVRTHSLGDVTTMRDLNPEDVDQLIAVTGMVIRISSIIPDMKTAHFECFNCHNAVLVENDRGRIDEPQTCQQCSTQKSFRIVHNRCIFSDKQMIKLQETPDKVPDGQTPQTVLAFAFDHLVDSVQPGDLVEVTGIYKATPLRINPAQRVVKAVFKTHLDVIHFKKRSSSRMGKETGDEDRFVDQAVLDEREQRLRALAAQPDIYDQLVAAFAPSIYEFDDVKRGVLCQLFGATHKEVMTSGRGRFRGDINILLCGDPGTSKSQVLQHAVHIAPRGMYTSGKGSSAVGLTAYVTRDPETRQIVLESGALVLCDGGICCIDEFDKMNDSTRSVLHEAMEQQTVSIAKAGIIASLNARTSILAAANPQESQWNKNMSIVDNIQLPPTLLSRFDLIYLILDNPDKDKDRRLARHIVSLYFEDPVAKRQPTLSKEELAEYITFARKHINPQLTEEACRSLMEGYVEMRKAGNVRQTISATPRQLESLIRLSEAHARMRFSQIVEEKDVNQAIRLVKTALQQAATDPRTGLIDYELIATGKSSAERHMAADLVTAVEELLRKRTEKTLTMTNLLEELEEQSSVPVTLKEVRKAVDRLEKDELVKFTSDRTLGDPSIRVLV